MYGFWGKGYGGAMVMVGMHTLPAGITVADIGLAILRVPRTDNPYSPDESCLDLDMRVKHIDASNDTMITLADKDSAPLDDIGQYRAPGPYVFDDNRFVEFDVPDCVEADVSAGRLTFAWRVGPESIPDSVTSYRYFPTVDNIYPPIDNRAKLFLFAPGFFETDCADGTDNDGDGDTDCDDSDCFNHPACTLRADFDGDGDVDQEDFGHLQACLTGSILDPVSPGCEDADLNDDSQVDQDDFGIFQGCLSGADNPADPSCGE